MYNYAVSPRRPKVTQFTAAPAVANPADSATQAQRLRLVRQPPSKGNCNYLSARSVTSCDSLTGVTVLPANLGALVTPFDSTFFYNTEGLPCCSVGMGNFGVRIAQSAGALGGAAAPAVHLPETLPAFGGGTRVAGSVGTAGSVGKLSVPAAWSGATAAPATDAAVPVSTVSAAPGGRRGAWKLARRRATGRCGRRRARSALRSPPRNGRPPAAG